MRIKYISSTILLVLLLGSSSSNAEEKDLWSWGAEEPLDPKDPLPIESHSGSSRTAKVLNPTSLKDESELALVASDTTESISDLFGDSGALPSDDANVDDLTSADASEKNEKSGALPSDDVTIDGLASKDATENLESASEKFGESGALPSDDVIIDDLTSDNANISVEDGGDTARKGRFLGLGDKLCSLGIGSNCKKNYQPAVQSHYGAPVKTLAPSGNYGPPPVPLQPAGNYGPPPVSLNPSGSYGPPPVKGYAPPVKQGPYPAPVTVVAKPAAKPPKGILGTLSDAMSSFLYKKPDTKPIAPYDEPKDVYVAPKPAYTATKPAYTAPKPAYTAPKPAYIAPKPAYSAPKPAYTASKPAYTAPKPAYTAPKPAYSAPKPAYNPPKPAYAAPKPAFTAPKPTYTAPKPAYTAPKVTYAAPKPAYTVPKASYAAPTPKPAYNAPKAEYAAPKPAYTAPKASYAAPTPRPAYTANKVAYAAPKPAYAAPKATYASPKSLFIAPTETYSITKPIMATRLPTVTVVPAQSVVTHVHSHTHVYQSVPSVATVLANAAEAAATITATPVIINVPSVTYAQKSDVLIPSGSEQSLYVQAGTVVSLNEVKAYEEECQCVPADFCPVGNIINPRKSSKDISHLLDARNNPSEIKSNSTDVNEATSGESKRERRDTEEVTEESNDEDVFSNRQGRQLKGFTPDVNGCSAGYVCCRRPVYNPSKPKQAFIQRKPTVTVHSSTLGTRPSNIAQQTKSQSTNRIASQISEVNSHFAVKSEVQKTSKSIVSAIANSNRYQQGPAYNEDCHCIPEKFCPASDVVPRNSPNDISHLLDARNKEVDILSTAPDNERVRRSTDNITVDTTGNFTENGNSTDRQGRQLLGVTPDSFGCHQGYACCRRPVFNPNKPKKINTTPFNSIANTAVVAQRPKPLNSISTPSQILPRPEVEVKQSTNVQVVIAPYKEDCHCVPRNICPISNIVPRNSPKDISHLLDARNKNSSILSTASEERVKRNIDEASGNETESDISARQGRQLQRYAPGKEGCGIDYVCCKRPVFTPERTQKAIIRPTRRPVQAIIRPTRRPIQAIPRPTRRPVQAIIRPTRRPIQLQRVPQPVGVSSHSPKPVVLVAQQSLVQHQVPAYQEQCTCVAPNFCQQSNIVARNSPLDISHLLDARNTDTNITSNATETRTRRSTHEEENDSVNEEVPFSDRQARQVKSFPPGVGGCHAGTVCCRQPNFSVQNAIPTVTRPPVVAQAVNVPQPRSKHTCGKSNSQSMLGRVKTPHFEEGDTEFGEYPWQAAILKMADGDAQYVCGAALIDDLHLLTAAHCIDGIQPYNLKIRLGEWDVASESEFFSHIQIQAADVYIHKDYYKGNLQNDIAVIKLSSPVDFASNPHITPVCLPDQSSDFRGQQCTVTGWGKDTFGSEGKFQKILKEVSVPVVDHRQCQDTLRTTRLGRSYSLDQGMLCAGGEEGRDACKGDGGSPLVCKGNTGSYHLAGLVSWGIGCGERGIPGVYVNIQHYLTWINAIQNS